MAALIQGKRRAAVVAGGLVVAVVLGAFLSTRAPASPALPAISAQDLLSNAIKALAAQPSVSGDAQVHVDLGIPDLPSADMPVPVTGPLGFLATIAGDHQLRVWRSADGARVAEILPAAERAVFANTHEVWLWDSTDLTAYHVVGPPSEPGSPPQTPSAGQLDPGALAARFLKAITPSTTVSVGDPTTVAGQPVYPLVLEPNDAGTLVGRVELDVDANNWIPLRAAVFPRGSDAAALSAGYTSVSFDPIDPQTFDFTPPPGATVKTLSLQPHARAGWSRYPTSDARAPTVNTFGHDWTEVVAVRVPQRVQDTSNAGLREIAGLLPYSGPLLSIDLVNRGGGQWLVAGLVPPSALAAAEARLP